MVPIYRSLFRFDPVNFISTGSGKNYLQGNKNRVAQINAVGKQAQSAEHKNPVLFNLVFDVNAVGNQQHADYS